MDMSETEYYEGAVESVLDSVLHEAAIKARRPLTMAEIDYITDRIEETHADLIEEEAYQMAVGDAEAAGEGDR